MRVHAQQQVLQHDGPPLVGDLECVGPRRRRLAASAVGLVRLQVAVGEEHVESLHARAVVELAALDRLLHRDGDLTVECREVAEARAVILRARDNHAELLDDLVDAACGAHGFPAASLASAPSEVGTLASHAEVPGPSAKHLMQERGWRRVLMVSHDYHLARIHMTSRRAGVNAVTVPAHEPQLLLSKPRFIAREVLVWLWYFARPAARSYQR